ncbi:MAG: polysaccharide deacetylase family protein [Candidatus Cloacimonetes bacterium]|nr:polysaccharide deacetylase family protein [Candidatus Cloacimonadota bacterium]
MSSNITDKILLSFDVEHWYLGFNYRGITGWKEDRWRDYKNIETILSILEKYNSRASFFVTGQYAEDYPEIVKNLHKGGHEIACHGYSHEYIYNQSPEVFQEETIRAKTILSDLINNDINGYRAASWSITKDSLWALDIIYKSGFKYDTSIYPTKNKKYGIYNAEDKPYQINLPGGNNLLEIPPQILKVGPLKLPVCGGVYLRMFPFWLHKLAIHKSNISGFPGHVMLHPHELDPNPPRLKVSLEPWLIKYFRIGKVENILKSILSEFNTITFNWFFNMAKDVDFKILSYNDLVGR